MEKKTGNQAKIIVEIPVISNGMDLGDRCREVAAPEAFSAGGRRCKIALPPCSPVSARGMNGRTPLDKEWA